jgi:hypothetical protein
MNPNPPYTGQLQPGQILVPKRIQYQYWDGEEGPWSMIPYDFLWPQPKRKKIAYIPPPVYRTEMWSANQGYPL